MFYDCKSYTVMFFNRKVMVMDIDMSFHYYVVFFYTHATCCPLDVVALSISFMIFFGQPDEITVYYFALHFQNRKISLLADE